MIYNDRLRFFHGYVKPNIVYVLRWLFHLSSDSENQSKTEKIILEKFESILEQYRTVYYRKKLANIGKYANITPFVTSKITHYGRIYSRRFSSFK